MSLGDLISSFQWWIYLFVIGIIFFPLTRRVFSGFFDKGYLFSKIIGAVVISYIVFVLGVTHIAPFTQVTIYGVALILAIGITIFLIKTQKKSKPQKSSIIILIIEEVLFLTGLIFWSNVRAHQPDIFGLEKYMDFGFVNSILRSNYFPPRDMWYTPLPINYYYFGHLVTAVLTKLSGIPSNISYNLMLATLFSFTFSLSFSLSGNIWHFFLKTRQKLKHLLLSFLPAGFIGGFLVSLGGNLHTLYTLFLPYQNDSPVPFWNLLFSPKSFPNSYWYPNATRFIYHTIHEFPSYSFVVSDLHGHVLDIPVVLTALAVLFAIIIAPATKPADTFKGFVRQNLIWIFYGFLLGVMYMTNAWDGMIYTLVSIPVIIYKYYDKNKNILGNILSFSTIQKLILLFACFLLFSLPFSFFFNPGALVGGIGLICSPQILINIGKIGPFVFEPDHCMHSPLWQLGILYGFFIFWLLSFMAILVRERKKITTSDAFITILSVMALLLILIPEFFYLRDIYTTYFRANTMFKLVYQAFILFSLANTFMIFRFIHFLKSQKMPIWKRLLLVPYGLVGILFFMLVATYSYFSVSSYNNNLSEYKGLNGTKYLTKSYPTDADAISWLNQHVSGQPVILEAQGDSYTEYARISANTGLPTVIGWPVHEWLWRGTYDIVPPRNSDIQTMYETSSVQIFKNLAQKYSVKYIFVGQLERVKYTNLNEEKFAKAGKIVFQKGLTKIYHLDF